MKAVQLVLSNNRKTPKLLVIPILPVSSRFPYVFLVKT